MPATAASVEQIMKQAMRIRGTLMPARRAASALPPTAYTCRPKPVRISRNVSTISSTKMIGTMIGTPLIDVSARVAAALLAEHVGRHAKQPARTAIFAPQTCSDSARRPLARRTAMRRHEQRAVPDHRRARRTPSPSRSACCRS